MIKYLSKYNQMMQENQTETTKNATALNDTLSDQILKRLVDAGAVPGDHVAAQRLADALNVSRSPIYAALGHLASRGILRQEPRRGYFIAVAIDSKTETQSDQGSRLDEVYFQLADDRLAGRLSDMISENQLRQRYKLTAGEVRTILSRVLQEGWIVRRPGYGWKFSAMLTTSDALVQTYRLRAALEPAGLRESTFQIDVATLDKLEETERNILNGGLETMPSDTLYSSGVVFHETLAEASGNPYILDALKRVNTIRRLLAYRANLDRQRYLKQSNEHLQIIEMLRLGRNEDAAISMQHHISTVIYNLEKLDLNIKP